MKHIINSILLVLAFLQFGYANASLQQDTLSIDDRWNTVFPSKLSPDAKWVLISKRHQNKFNKSKDSLLYINTLTKQKVDIGHLKDVSNNLLYNDLVVGKVNQDIIIEKIGYPSSKLLVNNIRKFTTKAVENQNLLITLSSNNEIKISIINSKGQIDRVLISDLEIGNYFINSNKTKLVYQKNDTEQSVFVVDLQTFKNRKIDSFDYKIEMLYWNKQQDVFAFKDIRNIVYLVNTTTNSVKSINLKEKQIERFEINFYSNNDVFIKYNVKSDKEIPATEYLDIWNGNSKLLVPSNFKKKYEIIYKTFVYNYQRDTLKELQRTRENDYEFIDLPNHLLSYNPFEHKEFDSYFAKIKYTLIRTDNFDSLFSTISRSKQYLIPSQDNKYVLYIDNNNVNQWKILDVQSKKTISITSDAEYRFIPMWSENSQFVFYVNNDFLIKLNVKKGTHQKLFKVNNQSQFTFLNSLTNNSIYNTLDTDKPILLLTSDEQVSSIYKINKNKIDTIVEIKDDNISQARSSLRNLTSKDLNIFIFTQENYNKAPDIMLLRNNKVETLLSSDIPKELYFWRQKKNIFFKDKYQKELQGTLYYPKGFDSNKQYPMIVYTYNFNRTDTNFFEVPTLLSQIGFNIPLLTELGYFVFYTQTYVSEQGPGISALECITKGIKAITQTESSIDSNKLGLIGHSFGGYKSSFIATQSNLFKAVVSGAAAHDLIGGLMYRYSNMRNIPDWFMTESAQYAFNQSYAESPEKYLANSPILHAHKTTTPMLLWTGLLDENVYWENTRKMYIALKRYQVPTIALFYKDIDHALGLDHPIESEDLTKRTIDWFDYFLKDKKDIKWIEKGINYDNTTWSPLDNL